MPLPLLAAVHRAAQRVRGLAKGSVDPAPRALAALAAERVALAARAPELNLGGARLLAASEDRLTYRVAWRDEGAVLKLALASSADRRLRREGRVLRALGGQDAPGVPRLLAQGRATGGRFQVESLLPGQPAATDAEPPLASTAALIAPIHARTATEIAVDTGWLDRHVDRPIVQVDGLLRRALGQRAELAGLASLRRALHAALNGRPLRVALTHGDYWRQNVLVDERGVPSGIVDWDSAACAPPAIDALHLILYRRRRARGGSLGAELGRLVEAWSWSDAERACLSLLAPELLGAEMRSLAWLYWLRFVTGNMARHPSLARDRGWMIGNVALPLRHA